ncbi:amino acid adenylation domain protein [Leptolyngbya sp. Heron Island J]|uniref:non-ribosomal peptide synthetase n=1 Tax=Leptolyngbya sp. Heron Island J TaxID=1385935 RepID=UPI0003B9AAF1|nr:non-ribosomal peptide synthetase [Leptolyngbya sp. Heron Island J]ESA35631.1 amino acid adenylation domain protein [Leptolyngbya sp. Heron Island J]
MSHSETRNFQLSSKKRALLERLLQENGVLSQSRQRIPRRSDQDTVLLSSAQQRLWFLDQLESGNFIYNIPAALRLTGSVNIDALNKGLRAICQRHEVLRTTFSTVDGKPVSTIHQQLPQDLLTVVNLEAMATPEREETAKRLAVEEARRPFNLGQDMMMRAVLFRLHETDHLLLLSLHHIASDGWSLAVLVQELSAFYTSFDQSGASPERPELAIQYADFALWQHQRLQGEEFNRQLDYWRKKLSGDLPLLQLPSDRLRPAVSSLQGALYHFKFSNSLSTALKELSQKEQASLFMTLLAAFKVVLYRYTGQNDILVGTAVANRQRTELEEMIGVFVNTLVLRTDLSSGLSFRRLLQRVKDTVLEADAHQDFPFEKLVETMRPERSMSHNPLFQVMFVLQNAPMQRVELPALTLDPVPLDIGRAQLDLSVNLVEMPDEICGWFEYSTDLFELETVECLFNHFHTLLHGIVANPDQSIDTLPLLSPNEKHRLLTVWNQNQLEYPSHQCLHQLFELQAEQTPDEIAIVLGNDHISYHALNQRANQLAHYLRAQGITSECLVGICTERSIEMVVGILAVLKAGGGYVPLDPAYPAERLAFIVEDSQISIVLSQKNSRSKIPQSDVHIVDLDVDWPNKIEHQSADNVISGVSPKNLAYLIYTSGSTGKPKGIMIQHQSAAALIGWAKTVFTPEQLTGVLASTSICFDLSVFELFLPLSSGGRVILAENILSLPDLPAADQVTLINTVPSAIAGLLKANALPDSVRTVNLAGEPLGLKLVQEIYQQQQVTDVFNLYGPSEDTTYSTFSRISKDLAQAPSIGRPIANTQAYILDNNLQPVPINVVGELFLGGAGLARGYWQRPELTDEKFVQHPFSPEPDARLYRTGDLVRYRSNGEIEFLGRTDHQVKVRGFRIELQEIEATLQQHRAVREAIVIAHLNQANYNYLVAYVIPSEPNSIDRDLLRQFLQTRLPDYMVPEQFVFLDEFPLLPSGKVDRSALTAPSRETTAKTEPSTPAQKVLAEIWSDLLGLDKVGIHDNFFELGGDSILSIQVVARASQAGLYLIPKQLFQHQTIAELAKVVNMVSTTLAEQGVITGAVPLTPIQHWFFEQQLPEPHHWNQSVLLQVQPSLNPDWVEQILQQLLVQHDALRLRFTQKAKMWSQTIADVNPDSLFEYVDLSGLSEVDQQKEIDNRTDGLQASLNLFNGPLIRAALFNLGNHRPCRLLFIVHHLVVDGISWRILLEQFFSLYHQLQQGQSLQLPAKTSSYKLWAEHLVTWTQSPHVKQELSYWLDKFKDVHISPLPIDSGDVNNNSEATVKTVSLALESEETKALLQEVPLAYQTQINEVLLTALALSFEQWTKSAALLIDVEGHGREELFEDLNLSGTVGWFTAVFPVLLTLGNKDSLSDSLKQVKEQLRQIPNCGVGFGAVKYLSKDSDAGHQLKSLPKSEVSFNYLGRFDQVLPEVNHLQIVPEMLAADRGCNNPRRYLIDVNSYILKDQLRVDWTYSEKVHQAETVADLAQNFLHHLKGLIRHCQSPDTVGYTVSDFPDAGLNQQEFDEIIAQAIET